MQKLKDSLKFTGFIMVAVASIAYLGMLYIMIDGFENTVSEKELVIFLIIGAVYGIFNSLFLRVQGISLAKMEEIAKEALDNYNKLTVKDKNFKSKRLWLFHLKNILTDIFVKAGTIGFTIYFSITIIVKGIGDWKYFGIGIINVILYNGLGLLGLAKAYDFYLEHEVTNIKNKIYKLKEEQNEETERLHRESLQQSGDERRNRSSERVRINLKRDLSYTNYTYRTIKTTWDWT